MAANNFNDTVLTAVRYAGLDENGQPNDYAGELAAWGIDWKQAKQVIAPFERGGAFDVAGASAALQAAVPANTMQSVAQFVDTMGQAKDREQKASAWDQGPLGGLGTALMGTGLIAGAGALGGAFSGAGAAGGGGTTLADSAGGSAGFDAGAYDAMNFGSGSEGAFGGAGAAGTRVAGGGAGGMEVDAAAAAAAGGTGETLADLTGGTGAGAGGAATSASGFAKYLDGTATADDWLSLLGKAAPGVIGAFAADSQTKAINDLAAQQKTQYDEYKGFGAPYRTKLTDLYADPSTFLTSKEVQTPVQQGSDIMARSLSMTGNPTGSGNALQQLQSYSADQLFGKLGQEKDRLAGYGGLTAYNQAAAGSAGNQTLNLAGLQSGANVWNAAGAAANNIFNPPKSYAQQMAEWRSMGGW